MTGASNHASPLSAVDQVEVLDDTQVRADKVIRSDDPYLAGHYPGFPIYPGVFTLETVRQAVVALVAKTIDARCDVRLREIRSMRLMAPLLPGDRLCASVTCHPQPTGELLAVADCTRDGTSVARLTLVCTVNLIGCAA